MYMTPILGQSNDASFQVTGSALTTTIAVRSTPVSLAARVRTRARSLAGTGPADAGGGAVLGAAEGSLDADAAGGTADADGAAAALDDGVALGPPAPVHATSVAHRRMGTMR
jgi:hypothetical protein